MSGTKECTADKQSPEHPVIVSPPYVITSSNARRGRRELVIGVRLPGDIAIVDDNVLVLDVSVR
jgi:hypothetical protein